MKPLILILLAAAAAHAQVQEQMTVEVVNVPVYVSRGGVPVEGLTREDFELFVNGKAQRIEYFDVIRLGEPAEAPEAQQAPRDLRQRRLFLFVFDLSFAGPFAILRGQRAAAHLLENAGPHDAFGVVTLTPTRGVELAVPFTSDRPAVRRAIAELRASHDNDPLRMSITATERGSFLRDPSTAADEAAMSDETGGPLTRGSASSGGSSPATAGVAAGDNAKMPVLREIEGYMKDLAALAESLAGLEGQKHVVLLSEGFNAGVLTREPRINEYMYAMFRRFQTADTFLHTMDTAGLRLSGPNPTLFTLSVGTGGQWLHNRNDLDVAMTDLAKAHSVEYLLGFTSRGRAKSHNTIEVRVKGAGRSTNVTYRRGFSTGKSDDPVSAIRLSDIVLNDIPQTGTAPDLILVNRTLFVGVPPDTLMPQLQKGQTGDLYVYVFDPNGVAVMSRKSPVTVKNMGFRITLSLPSGPYVVKALLVIDQSIGFRRLAVTLP